MQPIYKHTYPTLLTLYSVTAAQVGLGNVNNTSDADKPISTATQAALGAIGEQITTLLGQISAINNLLNQDGYSVLFVKGATT